MSELDAVERLAQEFEFLATEPLHGPSAEDAHAYKAQNRLVAAALRLAAELHRLRNQPKGSETRLHRAALVFADALAGIAQEATDAS